jgi:hypothetical protein
VPVKLRLPATVKLPLVLTTAELSLAFGKAPFVILVAFAANVVALVYASLDLVSAYAVALV